MGNAKISNNIVEQFGSNTSAMNSTKKMNRQRFKLGAGGLMSNGPSGGSQ